MPEKNPNPLGAASSFLEQLVYAEIIWINVQCWPMLVLLKQEEQDAGRKSPLPVLCATVKLWAGVTPKCTPRLQNIQQKQNTKYLERESGKLNPNGMQNKSLQSTLLVILRNIISMCVMREKEINTIFSGLA